MQDFAISGSVLTANFIETLITVSSSKHREAYSSIFQGAAHHPRYANLRAMRYASRSNFAQTLECYTAAIFK